jgi:hypothetical protein
MPKNLDNFRWNDVEVEEGLPKESPEKLWVATLKTT